MLVARRSCHRKAYCYASRGWLTELLDAMAEELLDYTTILNAKALAQVAGLFAKLPTIQRARWRWIFPEPNGAMSYPRQRAHGSKGAKSGVGDGERAPTVAGRGWLVCVAPDRCPGPAAGE